jgi:hypothetical protein
VEDARRVRTSQRLTLICIALALGTFAYVAIGLGYHRLMGACYDSRHSIDMEPMVGGGAFGVVIDTLMWPVFLAATPADISCLPRPLGE